MTGSFKKMPNHPIEFKQVPIVPLKIGGVEEVENLIGHYFKN